jgi:CRISPR-associated protein Csb2
MITIKMRFLAGRFHSTPWGHHVNEGVIEYPPSVWRLLRGLVATYHRTAPVDCDLESLKRILDALSDPPEFHLPSVSVAHSRHYDQANGGIKFFDTFVSISRRDQVVWIWPHAELASADRRRLAELLRNLGTFGRSESWCEAELADEFSIAPNSRPVNDESFKRGSETIRLLIPIEKGDGLLSALLTETSEMRKAKQLEPTGTRWVTYERDSELLRPNRFPRRIRPAAKVITVARFAISSTVLPLVTGTMPFADAARREVSRNRAGNSFSETLIGKDWDGDAAIYRPSKGHRHAHFLPTDEDGDGRLDHLTVFAPCGFNDDDLGALDGIRSVKRPKNLPAARLVLTGLGNPVDFRDLPLFKQAKVWRSATPFSLPNFPNRGGGKPPRPRDLPESQLAMELRRRGLPDPIRIARIEGYETEKRPVVRWLEFHAKRKQMTGKGLCGFEIEFESPVAGPITVGFGSHFGLGLFLPVE